MENGKTSKVQSMCNDTRRVFNYRPMVLCALAFGMGVCFSERIGSMGSFIGAALFLCLAAAAYVMGLRRMALFLSAMILGALRICLFTPELPEAGEYHVTGIIAQTPEFTEQETVMI